MNRLPLLEKRLELIKHVGNLQLEYLQRLYDRRTVAELYRQDQIVLHIHGVWRDGSRWCLTIKHVKGDAVNRRTAGAHEYRIAVFVRVTEVSNFTHPVVSSVGLKPLKQCDMFTLDALEKGWRLLPKCVWRLTYRKLQAFISSPAIKNGKSSDEVVKGGAKRLDDFTYIDCTKSFIGLGNL